MDYTRLFRELGEPAFVLDPDTGEILDVSDAAARMLQYSRVELLDLTVADLHPFELERFTELVRQVREHGHARARGLTCRCREGVFIPAEITASSIEIDGRSCVLAIARDLRAEPALEIGDPVNVTEFRTIQDRLARIEYLLDHAPEMVLWIDPDGSIIYANQTAAETLGMQRSKLQQMAIWDVDVDLRADEFPNHVEAMRSQGHVRMDRRMRTAAGETFPVTVTGQYIRQRDQDVIISFSRDISEEVRARGEARRYLSELARVSRQASISELASAISHEINQPLTALLTRCQSSLRVLDQGNPDPETVREQIHKACQSAEHIREIVARLRDYMKNGESQREAMPAAAIIQRSATLLHAEARHTGVDLAFSQGDALPTVRADSVLVQQVILNLVRNALEAVRTAEGPIQQVRVHADTTATGALQVEVTDTGPGIDAGARDQVFEPFFSTKGEGLGIGLSLCRSIIESHDGELALIESSGRGSTFRFTLPPAARAVSAE